ncbi:MAG: tetratricopeptide repeat protein [Bacteroidia bacterium]|nr:tetratricopeptide repeat protein [Bacteroidia bacterium]
MNLLPDKFFENKKRLYLLLIAVPVLIYLKSLFYGFSPMDEQWLILRDTKFIGKWESLWGVFNDSIQGIYYRPVLWMTFILDSKLGGVEPFFFHLTNIVFHALAVVVVFRLLNLIHPDTKISFLLALLFALHPLMLNAVAWVPGRNDSLLCIFVVLSLSGFINYLNNQKTIFLLQHLVFFILAFLTKESAVLLPVLYLIVYFTYSKYSPKLIVLILAWGLVSAIWFVVRNSLITYYPVGTGNLVESIQKTLMGFVTFAGKAFFPVKQSIAPTVHNSSIIAGIAMLVLVVVLFFKPGLQNKKIARMGLLMYVILLLVPVWFGSNAPLGIQDEHRGYTPMVGLLIFVAQINYDRTRVMFTNALLILSVVFGIKTFWRMDVYQNASNYTAEGVKDCPENFIFHFQKADELSADKRFAEAISYYNQAIALRPDRAQLYHNRANAYAQLGNKDKSVDDFSSALQLSDYKAEVYLSRMLNYRHFGEIEKCVQDLQAINARYPGFVAPKLAKSIAEEWIDYSIVSITKMMEQQPANAGLYVNRAKLYMDKRKGKEALADLKKATELEPANTEYKAYYKELEQSFPH